MQEVPLTDALLQAHIFADLSGEMAAQDIAVLRLMLAVPHAVFSQVDAEGCEASLKTPDDALQRWKSLRVWGGGLYNREIFYRLCDELGILLWHDFMFGCACYPDHLEAFRLECEREMEFQTRRLRNHPCMALFCGNNENHQIFDWQANPGWGIHPGLACQSLRARSRVAQLPGNSLLEQLALWWRAPGRRG